MIRSEAHHGGQHRPWPVRFMQPGEARLFEDMARKYGRSFQTVSRTHHAVGAWKEPQLANLHFGLGAWHLWGRQSFRIAPLLAEALRDTSLHLVPSDALRSPYPACWVECALPLTGPHEQPFIGFFLMSCEFGSDPYYAHIGELFGFPSETRVFQATAITEDPTAQFETQFFLCGKTLEESIERSRERAQELRATSPHVKEPSAADRKLHLEFWSFVSNFLLYLSSPDPDLQVSIPSGLEKEPKSAKAKAIQEKIRKREGHTHILGYRLTRILRSAKGSPSAPGGGEGRPVAAHLVRGHFKAQAHGPGRTERKIIWVAPYRRGDDGSEERIERSYIV